MFKRNAVALAVAAIALAFAGCEHNQAEVSELPRFESREAFAKYISNPDNNTLVFVWGIDCKGCDQVEQVLKQTASVRTDIKFFKVDAAWTTVKTTKPYIAFLAPEAGITSTGNPEALDSVYKMSRFLSARVAGVKTLLPLKKALEEARAKLKVEQDAYEERSAAVRTRMTDSLKEQDQLLSQLRSQLNKEAAPFDAEILAIEARKSAAQAATRAKLDAALEKKDELRAPFRLELKSIHSEFSLTADSLQEDLDAALEALKEAQDEQSAPLKQRKK